jgi:hypothetical protein
MLFGGRMKSDIFVLCNIQTAPHPNESYQVSKFLNRQKLKEFSSVSTLESLKILTAYMHKCDQRIRLIVKKAFENPGDFRGNCHGFCE